MDTEPIFSYELLGRKITDLLRVYPRMLKVFMKYQPDCIGCSLASFCRLSDAIKFAELDSSTLLQEINYLMRDQDSIKNLN